MTGFYRTKPVSVEAFQWDGALYASDPSGASLTTWIGRGLPHSHIAVVKGRLQVVTAKGARIANAGDWIVWWRNTSKTLEVFTDEEFQRMFDIDHRAARIRGWRPSENRKDSKNDDIGSSGA